MMPPPTIATPNATWWLRASERVSTSSLMALRTVPGRENRQTVAADQAQR